MYKPYLWLITPPCSQPNGIRHFGWVLMVKGRRLCALPSHPLHPFFISLNAFKVTFLFSF